MVERILPEGMLPINRADVEKVVTGILATVRKEAPSAYEVEIRVGDFAAGTSLAAVLEDTVKNVPPVR